MKKSFLTILLFTVLTTYGQMDESYLFRIGDDELSEIGTSCGYVNSKGDTVIAVGQFRFCYTDTIRYIGIVLDTNFQCKAIDNEGKYLYDVKWFDNGPDYVSEGLFRIIKNGKIGYANEKGEVIVEPQFECTSPFEDGRARVTYSCNLIDDGEHKIMQSNHWFYIDKTGNKID